MNSEVTQHSIINTIDIYDTQFKIRTILAYSVHDAPRVNQQQLEMHLKFIIGGVNIYQLPKYHNHGISFNQLLSLPHTTFQNIDNLHEILTLDAT